MKAKITKAIAATTPLPTGKAELVMRDTFTPGLCLRIRPASRTWLFIRDVAGKRTKMTLGQFPAVSVEAARDAVAVHAGAMAKGIDPVAEAKAIANADAKAKAAVVLFKDKLDAFLDAKEYGYGSVRALRPRSHKELKTYLRQHWKKLHPKPLKYITKGIISEQLDRIAKDNTPKVADKARMALSGYFKWLISSVDGLDYNPVSVTLPKAAKVERDRVLIEEELAALWQATADARTYNYIVRLLVLTGARFTEIASMRWEWLEGNVLTIPSSHTKNHLPCKLPLPDVAMAEVARIPRNADWPTVFSTSVKGYHHSTKERDALMKRVEAELGTERTAAIFVSVDKETGKPKGKWTIHDIRRSLVTHCNTLECAPHVIEAIVNHKKPGAEGIYNRADYMKQKAKVLQDYADWLKGLLPKAALKFVA